MRVKCLLVLFISVAFTVLVASCSGVAKGAYTISYSITQEFPIRERTPLTLGVFDFTDSRKRIVTYKGEFAPGPKWTIREADFAEPIPKRIKELFIRDLNNLGIFKEVKNIPGKCPTNPSEISTIAIEKGFDLLLCAEISDFWMHDASNPITYVAAFTGIGLALIFQPIIPTSFRKGHTEISYKLIQSNNGNIIWKFKAEGKKRTVGLGIYYGAFWDMGDLYTKLLYTSLEKAQTSALTGINQFFSAQSPTNIALMRITTKSITSMMADTKKTYLGVHEIKIRQGISPASAPMLTDAIRDACVRSGRYNVLDRDNMEAMLTEIGFQQTGCTDSACIVQMGRQLGVKKMLTGSVGRIKNTIVLTLMLIDVETGKIEKSTMYRCRGCSEEDMIFKMDEALKPLFR